MSITMVNGFACSNCSDVSKAKRGEDPQQSAAEKIQADAAKVARSDALIPEAIPAIAESERPRAKLDFSNFVDKLA